MVHGSSTIYESARTQRRCPSSFDESARTKAHFVCIKSRFPLTKRVFRWFLSRELFSKRVFRDQKRLFESKKARFECFNAQCSSTNGESARSVSLYLLILRRFVDQERPNREKESDYPESLEAYVSFRPLSVSSGRKGPAFLPLTLGQRRSRKDVRSPGPPRTSPNMAYVSPALNRKMA
jgi:hypothetical protein